MDIRSRYIVVLFLTCLLSAPVLLLSQSASALFEQGLLKENAEGSLNEAIAVFSQIAEDKTVDPAIRARAQLHVGICYEKLGRREARAAYEKLIANFPQQASEVTLARERIAALARTIAAGVDSTPPDVPQAEDPSITNTFLEDSCRLMGGASCYMNPGDATLWIMPPSSRLGPYVPGYRRRSGHRRRRG